jgi:histidine triad (HIT) family protein
LTNCPFCKIAEGIASASLVYEDDNVLAFLDINPSNIGHTLVVPRDHWENIFEIPEKILAEIIVVTKKISTTIKKTVNAQGIKIIQLNGRAAGQMVMHIHFHIIPILSEFEKISNHVSRMKISREKLDETALKIKTNL